MDFKFFTFKCFLINSSSLECKAVWELVSYMLAKIFKKFKSLKILRRIITLNHDVKK